MEVTDDAWQLVGILASATIAGGAWLYARVQGSYNRLDNRIDKVTTGDTGLHRQDIGLIAS